MKLCSIDKFATHFVDQPLLYLLASLMFICKECVRADLPDLLCELPLILHRCYLCHRF